MANERRYGVVFDTNHVIDCGAISGNAREALKKIEQRFSDVPVPHDIRRLR